MLISENILEDWYYTVGNAILNRPKGCFLLVTGVTANLLLLGYFKYTHFLLDTVNLLAGWHYSLATIILPVGISFYTFTQIAFLVDCQKGESHRYRFVDYLLFVTFFPHLVAGPILNHKSIMPQLQTRFGMPTAENTYRALIFFSAGLFKKVMIADNLAPMVHSLFDPSLTLSFAGSWLAALLYTLQLYYDFSGYSEMAVGLALLMNITIPFNFNSPYKATSIIDFWRRWHISLSSFLRDYLYIPLGGNRKGGMRRYGNLLLTMLLGGLWHGAGWNFVIWGLWHGTGLVINHLWRRMAKPLPGVVAWGLTFVFVMGGWVFFRADTLPCALHILSSMAGLNAGGAMPVDIHSAIAWSIILLVWTVFAPNTIEIAMQEKPRPKVAMLMAFLLAAAFLGLDSASDFLYFKF